MNAITEDLHYSKNTRHNCQLVRSWQVCFVIGVIHVDFHHHGVTVNVQYYGNLLHSDAHQVIQKKIPGNLSKIIILLHDTCSHTADLIKLM
jgi:hypothetical protein